MCQRNGFESRPGDIGRGIDRGQIAKARVRCEGRSAGFALDLSANDALAKLSQHLCNFASPFFERKVLRIVVPVLDSFVQNAVKRGDQPLPATNAGAYIDQREALQLGRGETRLRRNLVYAMNVIDPRLHEPSMKEASTQ